MDEIISSHQKAAQEQPHDNHGHFTTKPHTISDSPPPVLTSPSSNINSHASLPFTSVSKTPDDNTLVDIHVGNPAHKIIALLQDIKNQKAFSFDIKGSLGLAGVLLVLANFGLFGGAHLLCDKGEQPRVGAVKILQATQNPTPSVFPGVDFATSLWNRLVDKPTPKLAKRIILIAHDLTTYTLDGVSVEEAKLTNGKTIIASGNYDSCTTTLSIKNSSSLQQYQ